MIEQVDILCLEVKIIPVNMSIKLTCKKWVSEMRSQELMYENDLYVNGNTCNNISIVASHYFDVHIRVVT